MGLFRWLFGASAPANRDWGKPSPVQPGRSCKARYTPPGDWVQTTGIIHVAGIQYRKDAVEAFVRAAQNAELKGDRYGVDVSPEPSNAHDRNALVVEGFTGGRKWKIGYVDAATAAELSRDLLSKGLSIAAELYEIWVGDSGHIDVKIIILAPPGNSLKVRLKNKRS